MFGKYFSVSKLIFIPSLMLLSILASGASQASPMIFEFSSFIHSSTIGGTSLQDSQIGGGVNDFGSAGLDVSVTNNLDADNFGTFSWNVTNNGSDLSDVSFFGFLDAEIDEPINTFFNEFGDSSGFTAGAGSSDSAADSWEIDEPGFIFGDIFANLLDGALDNTNSVTSGLEDDVSMALGFDLGEFLVNDLLVATFDISETDNGGLFHFDPDSNTGFFFNGSIDIERATAVPAPATLFLFAIGLVGLTIRQKILDARK